jgi:hypothetical protein
MATLLTNIIGPSNVLISSDIGSTVQAHDSNLTSFVNTFTLPTTDSTNGYALTTNGSGTLAFSAVAGGSFNISDNTSTTSTISSGETLKVVGANGITSTISGDTITIDGSNVSTDLTNISGNVLPSTTETYDLGSVSRRWRSLYLAGNTIDLAGATISSDGTGTISISATGATLPLNSNVQVSGAVTKNIALAGEDGSPVQSVPFFTNAGGLASQNTKLDFKADPEKIVANFTLNNGSVLGSAQGNTLFFF